MCCPSLPIVKIQSIHWTWVSLAREQQTIVVYMGSMKSAHLSSQLIKHGKASATPVALIENGTHKDQRVITCELQNLVTAIIQNQVQSPMLIVKGMPLGLFSLLFPTRSESDHGGTCHVTSRSSPLIRFAHQPARRVELLSSSPWWSGGVGRRIGLV